MKPSGGWATSGKTAKAPCRPDGRILAVFAHDRRGGPAAGHPLVDRLITLMRHGIVYPANTAEGGVGAVARALSAGELDTAEIPYYYRWALFDEGGQVQDPGNMDPRHLDYAKAALAGERDPQGRFYSQYHRLVEMPDGTTCVIQYDYSMPYGAEVLQRCLPEFQTCATVVLLLSWLTAGAVSTRHFAGLLRRDAALLTSATKTIAQQRLDAPLIGKAKVREFGETLDAMEQMRLRLASPWSGSGRWSSSAAWSWRR